MIESTWQLDTPLKVFYRLDLVDFFNVKILMSPAWIWSGTIHLSNQWQTKRTGNLFKNNYFLIEFIITIFINHTTYQHISKMHMYNFEISQIFFSKLFPTAQLFSSSLAMHQPCCSWELKYYRSILLSDTHSGCSDRPLCRNSDREEPPDATWLRAPLDQTSPGTADHLSEQRLTPQMEQMGHERNRTA